MLKWSGTVGQITKALMFQNGMMIGPHGAGERWLQKIGTQIGTLG